MNKKVLLVWPFEIPSRPSVILYHFVNLGTVGAELKVHGIDVEVFDGGAMMYARTDILDLDITKYDLICIISEPHNYIETLEIIGIIKSVDQKSKIFLFGTSATLLGTHFYKFDVDYIFVPQTESVAAQIAQIVLPEKKFQEQIVPPDLTIIPYKKYFEIRRKREVTIQVGKGCRFSCYFCRAWMEYGHKERFMELRLLNDFLSKNKEKFDTIGLHSPNFPSHAKWLNGFLELCHLYNIKWKGTIAPSIISKLDLQSLKDNGCYEVCLGVESFSKTALNRISKPIKEETVLELVNRISDTGIIPKIYLINGLPDSKLEDLRYTAEKLREVGGQIRVNSYVDYNAFKKQPLKYQATLGSNRALFTVNSKETYPNDLLKWQNLIPRKGKDDIHEYENYKKIINDGS
ncbi:Radical SAM superfamily enzyme YgiQ, UPF0313 family [Nitrosomonas aestuarii]|uniref:Radical SAM superfamily enzyme YgiQ, UPF0313 family n=1 Tax=Nitrosomonas aestuarii TaxID=52441 RepID=A0A1I4BMB9_9PROT|nr:radical SAM protein [Nitrosomonas aestuarii]SFK69530.1 Radical SAM superfamily enzyme YgiQ, UPF0313 family [Nitrosomonas aestuarii]